MTHPADLPVRVKPDKLALPTREGNLKIFYGLMAASLGLFVAVTQVDYASAQATTPKRVAKTTKGTGEAGKLKLFEDLAQKTDKKALPKTGTPAKTTRKAGGQQDQTLRR